MEVIHERNTAPPCEPPPVAAVSDDSQSHTILAHLYRHCEEQMTKTHRSER